MAINYAEKYSNEIDERFKLGSLTKPAFNNNYSYNFEGVNKINVYSVDTVPLVDYNLEAKNNRYGTPQELGNDKQEMTLTQDKAFTFTIDNRNLSDTLQANNVGSALRRQIDEVITPTVDKYNISVLVNNAGTKVYEKIAHGKIDFPDNIPMCAIHPYDAILNANIELTENKVPLTGRIIFITPVFYRALKQDPAFKNGSNASVQIAVNGSIGSIDGMPLVVIPSDYFPKGANFLITHPLAAIAPVKLAEYKTHDDAPGYSGWLCEGRIYYDTFVLKNKKKAIYYSVTPDTTLATLYIGNKVLNPTFDGSVTEYSCSTTDATNTITATANVDEAEIEIRHYTSENEYNVIKNGSTVSWNAGAENTIKIFVTIKHSYEPALSQTTVYTVKVTTGT